MEPPRGQRYAEAARGLLRELDGAPASAAHGAMGRWRQEQMLRLAQAQATLAVFEAITSLGAEFAQTSVART